MTSEAQTLLYKSLNDVCRLQQRQHVGFILLFFSEIGCVLWLAHISEIHPLDISKLVVAAMFFVLVSLVYVAMAFASLQLRMTKKILQAIEFASKT